MNSTSSHTRSDLFHQCWRLPHCEACLSSSLSCSWCATSQVCVPNDQFKWPFAILAPIKYEGICPLSWRERWEMRAKPFSCRCSTMTLMSVVVAIMSTLAGVLLIWFTLLAVRSGRRAWKGRKPGWWRMGPFSFVHGSKVKTRKISRTNTDDERQALLDNG